MTLLERLFRKPRPVEKRRRLERDGVELAYAIGDIHGRLDLLLRLEARILEDAARLNKRPTLIYLGDYVDRGPQSAQVLDHLIRTRDGERVYLAGNHEVMMQGFCASPSTSDNWLGNGGYETLVSYAGGSEPVDRALRSDRQLAALVGTIIPKEHLDFLAELPVMARIGPLVLVHAGVRPGIPLDQQSDEDLILYRGPAPVLQDFMIVHGHTQVATPVVTTAEINIDTGAFATGRLTAARIADTGEVTLFTVT